MKLSFIHKGMLLVGIIAGVAAMMSAQGTQPVQGSADALLAEVRALRAEIAHVASAGIQAQLLVARLQLQEQRALALARQHADTESAVNAAQITIAAERARVRQLEEVAARTAGQGRLSIQQAILDAGAQIEQQQSHELQLQKREMELRRALEDAQTRWTYFNDQLDALGRSLPAIVPR